MIEVRELTKRFGPVEAVRELSFTAAPGRITGFLGPNGAGKTTTMRMILGLVEPDVGDALVLGRRYRSTRAPMLHVGAALDAGAFHPKRTGRNHLRALAAAGGIAATRVDEVLEIVDLTGAGRRRVGGYSLGMRQRLALACSLLGKPEVLILDEPANGLDPAGMRWLREFLRGFAERGTVLLSSHLLAEVAGLADDVVVIHKGRLVTQAPVADLTRDTRSLEDVFLELTDGGER